MLLDSLVNPSISLSGMHKKSLEAADALKSSDEEGEGDQEKTDASETSSLRDQRKSPTTTTPSSTSENLSPSKKPKKMVNGSPASSSMSPITVSSPVHHSPIATPKSPVEETSTATPRSKENFTAVSAPPPRQSSYHMSSHESAMSQQQHPLVHSSHPHPGQIYPPIGPINATPDTDPSEVFRWVNFNREYSSSFIRWIYTFNYTFIKNAIFLCSICVKQHNTLFVDALTPSID